MLGGLFSNPEKEIGKLLERYVPPHKKVSRIVTADDLDRVKEESKVLFKLCFVPHGIYEKGYAMAHPQIDDKDPLRFFVTREAQVIINPVIVRRSVQKIKTEGCMTFHLVRPLKVVRFNSIEVHYQTVTEDWKLTEMMKCRLSGMEAEVYQHEIDHFDAKYIYDDISIYDKSLAAQPVAR